MNKLFSALLTNAYQKNIDLLDAMDVLTVEDLLNLLSDDSMMEYNLTMKAMFNNVNVDSYQFNQLLVDLGLRDSEILKEIKDTRLLTSDPIPYYQQTKE